MKIAAPLLFASDLDGTLLPNASKRAEDGCLERTRQLLEALRSAACPVAYISGRHLSLARTAQKTYRLPLPDHWVCNVGTEIYDTAGNPDRDWRDTLGPSLGRGEILAGMRTIPHLALQENARQGMHKLSFYYPRPVDDALQARIQQRLDDFRSGLKLVDSVEESSGRALIDVIPGNAGKEHALDYLAKKHDLPSKQVFFAGDSDNDLGALISGVCGALVGNAPQAVRESASRLAEAKEGARVYLARAYYGDGVLEGLDHYGLVIRS